MGQEVLNMPDLTAGSKFDVALSDIEEVNPLFSKCFIKILYPGLNPNKVFIEKEVADEMAKTLYNIPIVGQYVESIDDFKDHGGKIEIENDEIKFVQTTKPYGVIPTNTDIEWMTVTESDGTQREYLTCWGYLWTGRYPEAKRVIEKGNPQSLELDEETLQGYWVREGETIYFKITEAVFSALAILGEDVKPAFASASITAYTLNKTEFSKKFNKMMRELRENELLKEATTSFTHTDESSEEGGKQMGDDKLIFSINYELGHHELEEKLYKAMHQSENGEYSWDTSIHEVYDDRAIVYDWDKHEHYRQYYTVTTDDNIVLGDKVKVKVKDLTPEEENILEAMKVHYEELKTEYSSLEEKVQKLEDVETKYQEALEEVNSLREFKQRVEKEEKEEIITKFTAILAEEDLKECRDNIDALTKDDIEAKLAVIAIRNKVSFNQSNDNGDDLIPPVRNDDDVPGWVKIVKDHVDAKKDRS